MFPLIPALALIYAGMLIESPTKRQQFMNFANGAGASVEKVINKVSDGIKDSGEANNESPEPESTEFH